MTPPLGRFGVWASSATMTTELAGVVESLGYGAIWLGGSPSGDLEGVAQILSATNSVTVATGIVNMWKDDAETVAASFHRIVSAHPNRFLLGVGVGHRERTPEYRSPYHKVVEYLRRLHANAVPRDAMILAALGPKSLALAAEKTAGTHPYFTSPRHTRSARELMGETSIIAPEQTALLDSDTERARETARGFTTRYLGTVNYSNNLRRQGWEADDLSAGGSDRLVDELVLHGEPEQVAAGMQGHLDAGANHVCVQLLDEDKAAAFSRLAPALGLTSD